MKTQMGPDCSAHRVQGEGMEYLPGESGAPGAPASTQTTEQRCGQEEPSKLWRQKFRFKLWQFSAIKLLKFGKINF